MTCDYLSEMCLEMYIWIYKRCSRKYKVEDRLYTLNEVMEILNKNIVH